MSKFYPLKFSPIYKERMWGGDMMKKSLNRILPDIDAPIGESWELVDRDDDNSVVSNGEFANMTISELLKKYKNQILGPKGSKYDKFPVLVKLLDAGERLSLQVHPEDHICKILNDGSEPKTEMWYVIDATSDGKILAGLNSKATKVQVMDLMDSCDIENMLQIYESKAGDGYFITSGTMHAIGAGNLILEIQQNSDTTFRISDWGRVDHNGNPRDLHVEKGLQSINFANRTSPKITGASDSRPFNRKFPYVKNCPHFDIETLHLVETWNDDTNNSMSFHIISSASGDVLVGKVGEEQVELKTGESVLIPYDLGNYSITPKDSDNKNVIIVKTTL